MNLHVEATNDGGTRWVKHRLLAMPQDKLIKIGPKVVHHTRYVTFQLAEDAAPRRLYRAILERIRRFADQRGKAKATAA